ncbi:autotransporter [Bradyrhizobium sp. SSBR45G]|uniref:autotransporter outer membrane beta-barrel domain-containing protein n=1 Tax=unclassified Bradyrhizobium TaxID=2631580 RepID=UPI0023428D24|nr:MULTISPECIES: autotransporter domain-containing protein [unclassified Bradyrhizobium]GLH79210.1 autotransporter [Bradyrhizobium sp. SSBR45G]GLH84645.1 autotransporter [Bradyrhizobium sp. SSBR45R]
MPALPTRRALLASTALTTLLLTSALPATAQNATWLATPGSVDFNTGTNWDTGNLPTGTATFGTSGTSNLTITSSATLGELVFDTGASNYTFSTNLQTLTLAGAGIVINGGSATFNMTGGMFVAMSFWNSASAGTATITGSGLSFFGNSTAGFANITNDSVSLSNSATLGHATFNNLGSLVFFNATTAGNATIDNHGSVEFYDTSTAGSSTITNQSGSTLSFFGQSTGGDATIINGGTVNFAGSNGPASDGKLSAGSIAGTGNTILGANELTVGGNNSSTTVSGIISGAGSLAKTGTGTMTLTGANTYAGGTTFAGGTVSVASDANLGGATGSLTFNGGTLQVTGTSFASTARTINWATGGGGFDIADPANTFTVSQALGGGSLSKLGAGTLRLTGVNSYTGGTTLAGGTVSVASDANLGGATGSLTFNGGTLQVTGTSFSSTARTINWGAGGGGFDITDPANAFTVSQALGGSGGLTKLGAGTLTLAGLDTYTGATVVNAGRLAVNGSIAASSGLTVNTGATLGGTGQLPGVIINAGGTLAPGNSIGTLTVNGNLQFNAGSTYTVDVSPSAADRTNVTGTATLTGATVNAVALPGSFRQQTYTILNATGGLGGTEFAGFNVTGSFSPARNPHLTYDLTNAYLVLDPSLMVLSPGASINQTNVANGINRAVGGGVTPPAGFDTLLNMPSNAAGRALDQLSGQSGTQAPSGATQLGGSFLTLLSNPSGRNGDSSSAPLGYAGERRHTPAAVRDAFAAFESPDRSDARWNVWGTGFGAGSRLSGDAATGSRDSSARAGAVAAGADYRVAPNTRAGFSLAGGAMSWSDSNGGGTSDLMMAGVYGRHEIGPTTITAAASYANYWMSTTRTVTVAGLDQLTARFNAQSFGGRIEAGHRLPVPFLSAEWTPYGSIQAQSFRTPGYAETAAIGSNQFALTYAGRNATAFRAELGVHTDRTIAIESGSQLTLFGRTAYAHDVVSNPALSANFTALGTASGFTVFGTRPSQNLLLTSSGAEWQLASGVSLMIRADTEWGERSRTTSGTGRIRYTW